MKTRLRIAIAGLAAVAVLAVGGAFAFGGGSGIWDDGHFAKPGSLDDGKDLLAQTTISLAQADAAAQAAATGSLGQVDLEHYEGKLVYSVDVGDSEVKVDAADGGIAGIVPRD